MSWGGEVGAKIRIGDNDRGYSLGNRFTLSSWIRSNRYQWVKPSLKISYEYSGHIRGLDESLLVSNAFPFPAPVTNPDLYGGKQANLILGLSFPLGVAKQLDVEIGKPLYQSLNGPQVREDVRIGLSLSFDL